MNCRGSCALGLRTPSTLTSYLPVDSGTKAWSARSDLTPEYAAAAHDLLYETTSKLRPSCWENVTPMIRISRADADVATKSDSHTPFVPRPWNAVIQAFGLGAGVDRTGETLVSYAIPFDSLTPTRRADGSTTYRVAARVVGYDLKSGKSFSVDTVREFGAPRTGAGARGHVSGTFEFAVDPGSWQVAVKMWQPGDSLGAYALLTPIRVDDNSPLMLSDLVLGAANGLSWTAPDGNAFPLGVLAAWRVGSTADLYYEVRGVKAGDEYRTVVTVTDPDAKGLPAIQVEANDRAATPTTAARKSIGLAQLKPGTYRLTVTVTHAGVSAMRARDLTIVKP